MTEFPDPLVDPLYETHVPAGAAIRANVYAPWQSPLPDSSSRQWFQLVIPAALVAIHLVDGCHRFERGGQVYVSLRSMLRPEVSVEGSFADDEDKWQWLEAQIRRLDLRNLRRDTLFMEHPLRAEFRRFEFTPEYRTSVRRPDENGRYFSLALTRITLMP